MKKNINVEECTEEFVDFLETAYDHDSTIYIEDRDTSESMVIDKPIIHEIRKWYCEDRLINSVTPFATLCNEIVCLQSGKDKGYSVSPFDELPVEVWLSQIQIKATRAKYAVNREKMLDELMDTAVYSLLTILKIRNMKVI